MGRKGGSLTAFFSQDFQLEIRRLELQPDAFQSSINIFFFLNLSPELFPWSPWLHSRDPHVMSARIHPHFQGTGFEALPLHFSKLFPWSSESVWSGLGSVKQGPFASRPLFLPRPSLHPSTFPSPLYRVICSEQSHLPELPGWDLVSHQRHRTFLRPS